MATDVTLADFTTPDLVVPRLQGRDTSSVVQELSAVLQRSGCLPDLLPFYHAALNREFLGSTAVAPGWALPHARIKGLAKVVFALGRADEPVRWGGRDSHPVRLVFLCAVPETDATGYMTLLGGIARCQQAPAPSEGLLNAPDARAMFKILKTVPLRPLPTALA